MNGEAVNRESGSEGALYAKAIKELLLPRVTSAIQTAASTTTTEPRVLKFILNNIENPTALNNYYGQQKGERLKNWLWRWQYGRERQIAANTGTALLANSLLMRVKQFGGCPDHAANFLFEQMRTYYAKPGRVGRYMSDYDAAPIDPVVASGDWLDPSVLGLASIVFWQLNRYFNHADTW